MNAVANQSVTDSQDLFLSLDGDPTTIRYQLLEAVPSVIGYYADGTSVMAADFYDETRDAAGVKVKFRSEPIVLDRVVKIRRAIAWAAEPLFAEDRTSALARLREVVQYETARPYRDTILGNRRNDSQAVGWERVTHGGCSLCQMLAANGAVYSEQSARFAAHPNCGCTAQAVFVGGKRGPEASVIQYVASRRNRTPAQREELRNYLAAFFPDN